MNPSKESRYKLFNKKRHQSEEVRFGETCALTNDTESVPKEDPRSSNTREVTRLTTMLEVALHSMQCNSQGEPYDEGIAYHFNYQGGYFDVTCPGGEEARWCRILFSRCYNVPAEDYQLALELCAALNWRCTFVKPWCGIIEEGESPFVGFHFFADIPWMNDVQGFVDLFRAVIQLFFEDRQLLHDEYSKRKFEQKLEAIDISEAIQSANK